MPKKGKDIITWVIATAIVGFIGTWCCSQNDLSFTICIATMTKFLPWEPGQLRMLFHVVGTSVSGVLIFLLLSKLLKKKDNSEPVLANLKELNLKAGKTRILRSFLLGFILFVFAYLCACFIDVFFETRFLHVDGSYERMAAWNFGRMFRYFILYVPFCLVISTLNNMVTVKGVSDSADTALNVLFTSLGMIILMLISFGYTYWNAGNPDIFHIQCTLSIIPLVPLCNYIYRKFYKLTGSVWLGAFFVAILIAWRCAGYISHQFMWYGSNEVAAFWGIY